MGGIVEAFNLESKTIFGVFSASLWSFIWALISSF